MLALGASTRALCEQEAAEPDLATIIQRLREWRSSFVNVRLAFEYWGPEFIDEGASRPSPGDPFIRADWIWTDMGTGRMEYSLHRDGGILSRNVTGCDGRKLQRFAATYRDEPERPGFLKSLKLGRMSSPKPTSKWGVMPLLEVYDAPHAEWLGDRLAEQTAELLGYGEVDGERCAKVSFNAQVLWLDPAHDFLVKRISRSRLGGDTDILFDVEEFQRVGEVWLPLRGTERRSGDAPDDITRWLVTEAAVNEALDPALFEPPAPSVGTRVEDANLGKNYRFGDKRPGETREREIAKQAKHNLSPTEKVIAVETFSSDLLWWSGLLLAVCLALLLVQGGIVLWRRRDAK
jgi:hypothetical protein